MSNPTARVSGFGLGNKRFSMKMHMLNTKLKTGGIFLSQGKSTADSGTPMLRAHHVFTHFARSYSTSQDDF